jgi:GH18 family chitinase
MQARLIRAERASHLRSFGARAGALSSVAILLALATACSNAGSPANPHRDASESVASAAAESKRVVGYLPNYRGALSEWTRTLDFSALTHINLAFAALDTEADGLAIHYREAGAPAGDEPGLAAFVAKAHANGTKVCLAVGGGGQLSDALGAAILKEPAELAEKLASYARNHDLDCIDIDQEEDAPTAELDAAFAHFIHDLAPRLHALEKQLSAAVARWNPQKILPVMDEFDFLNAMLYDFNVPWRSTAPVQGSSIADSQADLDWWVSNGADETKLVWGVPFYGYKWTGGLGEAIPYRKIVEELGSVPAQDQLEVGTSTITLNSNATIRRKAELAKVNYGGIMIWELWQGTTNEPSPLSVIKHAMR